MLIPASLAQTTLSEAAPPAWLGDWTPDGAQDLPAGENWYNLPTSALSATSENVLAHGILQITAELAHTCALTSLGGVKCWGDNWEGKLGNGSLVNSYTPVDVTGLSEGVISIAGTHKHTCALTSEGGVKCWGRNWHGELGDGTTEYRLTPVTPQGLSSGVKAIAAGGFHTCALIVDGTVRCWGANWHGQVGDGTTVDRHTPVEVIELGYKATAIAAGKYHTCAILETTGLRCWGYNKYGQIGNGPEDDALTPAKVAGLKEGVAAVALGENHSCALLLQNQIMCWGLNQQGQLGIGNTETQYIPVFVSGMESNAESIYTGQRFSCASAIAGGVYCWGENWAGQLGDGTQEDRLVPTLAKTLEADPLALSTGDSHACLVLEDGNVTCWGSNSHGQLGDGQTALCITPTQVSGLTFNYIEVISGGFHTCALTNLGGVKCWGNNQYGQLGDDTSITRITPVPVYGLSAGVKAIAVGGFHTCAMTATQVLCWGNNTYGQLGNGNRISFRTPVAVIGITHPPVKITAGTSHTCIIMDNGVVKCWGYNRNGQLGNGTRDDATTATAIAGVDGIDFSDISAGDRHTCAVTNAGKAYCWGLNENGQLGIGSIILSDVPTPVLGLDQPAQEVALGFAHSCVSVEDGSVRCWGNNLYGQLGDSTTWEHWLPVPTRGLAGKVAGLTAGGYQTCAQLASSNDVQCWGYNQSGQLGDGTTFTRMTPVEISGLKVAMLSAGSQTTCAISAENSDEGYGNVKCWGNNAWGQVGDGSLPWRLTPSLVQDLVGPSLVVNYSVGIPGSYFTVTGKNFEFNTPVKLSVNNLLLDTSLSTDADGNMVFQLDSSLAEAGGYMVSLQAGETRNVWIELSWEASLILPEDNQPVVQIPTGIALTWANYLPMEVK